MDLFNFKTSFLNPLLKWIAPFLFIAALYFFYIGRRKFGGLYKKGLDFLIISIVMGAIAFFFRVLADKIGLSFKWGESVFFLIFAIFNLLAALKFFKFIKATKKDV